MAINQDFPQTVESFDKHIHNTKKGKTGDICTATNSTNITSRQLAEAMAAAVNVPAVSIAEEEAAPKMGTFLPKFLTAENRASSAKAVKKLAWQPREPRLLEEIATGSYHRAAQELLKGSS